MPLLPTTPFLILAAACFMRSAPHWNAWLYQCPGLGDGLRDWHVHRTVSRRSKVKALVLLAAASGLTLWAVEMSLWVKAIWGAVIVCVTVVILLLPSRRRTVPTPLTNEPLSS